MWGGKKQHYKENSHEPHIPHWGEVNEHSDAAEVARICAQNIKNRIKTNALVRPRIPTQL